MSNQETNTQTTPAAPTEKGNAATFVAKRVREAIEKGTLHLPANYSAENALKSAWFILQTTLDKNKQPVLATCSMESVQNALYAMVVMGLNPAKKQCDLIAHGRQLVCRPSAEGDVAIVQRLKPGHEVYADIVYEKDTFDYSKRDGRIFDIKHLQTLDNIDVNQIKAVFAGIKNVETGENLGAILMTMAQVREAWRMSPNYKEGGDCPHNQFPDQFALRTIKRRFCKPIVRNSDDSLLVEVLREQEELAPLGDIDEAEYEFANGELIDFPAEESPDSEPEANDPYADQPEPEPVQQPIDTEPEPAQTRRF